MRKIIRLGAAALLAASAVVGTAALATADANDDTTNPGIQADVGWGTAPANPTPSASATATDVGWG
ncbi:hypothetical protein ACFY15_00775 [Streptomyces sp. NPDC001373]|uniref:hypothetical protein n=1 Tax=Streptomyces sp. NPDC001373 TaxID=3364565 RepID=UPI0036AC1ABC